MRKRLAIPYHLFVAPLTYGLVHDASLFELIYAISAANAMKLRNGEVDGALLTPIDYARENSDYLILPRVAVSSKDESNAIALFFRSGLSSISTVAVDIGVTSEIVLTRIILAEKYDINPQFIPMMPDLRAMLTKADAALLVGNAIFNLKDEAHRLDLVDEWTDLTELPYIHGFWGYRPNALNLDDRRSLLSAREQGIQNLDSITRNITHPGISGEYLHQFSYEFNEEAVNSISEFFRYSFYYGIIADIPEIRFDTSENESHSLSPN
ncbi:MAG: MqnA/MqnD/SBP family protein [Bacteroidota bacterium]